MCINPLNAELNPICHLLALLGAHLILNVSRIRVKLVIWNYDARSEKRPTNALIQTQWNIQNILLQYMYHAAFIFCYNQYAEQARIYNNYKKTPGWSFWKRMQLFGLTKFAKPSNGRQNSSASKSTVIKDKRNVDCTKRLLWYLLL